MGSVGASKPTNTFVGRSVNELRSRFDRQEGETSYKQVEERIRKEFNIPTASSKQIDTLRDVVKGMAEYDKGYDENRTPYNIESLTITQFESGISDEDRKKYGMRKTADPVWVSIRTAPNTNNVYIQMVDEKERQFLIGANGGMYDYGKNNKRVPVKRWDAIYGKHGWEAK